MAWLDGIFSLIWAVSDIFLDAYFTVRDWWAPFNLLQYPLLYLHQVFWSLLTPIARFHDWAMGVEARVQSIISAADIWSILATPIKWATDSWNWVINAFSNVYFIVGVWWNTAGQTVLAWVSEAKSFAQSLVNNVITWLGNLQTSWDNFWTEIFPTLATWTGVSTLIESAIKSWFPFYDDLVALWGSIAEFFADPQQYVYNKLDEFFERFW